MGQVEVRQLDITQTNWAVQELIEVTENPRHRYLLQAYDRHRNLEHAGRCEETFAPEMTVEHPVHRFNMRGQSPMTLEGREQVEPLYHYSTQTNQSIFYNEAETIAVGDFMVVSTMIGYQQTLGSGLAPAGLDADPDAMYLLRGRVAMIWPCDSSAASSARTSGSTTTPNTSRSNSSPTKSSPPNAPQNCSSPNPAAPPVRRAPPARQALTATHSRRPAGHT
jgi:hypothetical protein